MPAPRPRFQPTAIDAQTTGSVAGETPIGNSDVLALQKKLAALGLLAGTPDGLFGRRTAVAIRAFETKVGLQAHGKLTREVLAAVAAYPLPNGTAPVQPLPTETGDGALAIAGLAAVGLAFFGGGIFWALNAPGDPQAGVFTPLLVGWLAGVAGVGFIASAVFLVLQRMARAAERRESRRS